MGKTPAALPDKKLRRKVKKRTIWAFQRANQRDCVCRKNELAVMSSFFANKTRIKWHLIVRNEWIMCDPQQNPAVIRQSSNLRSGMRIWLKRIASEFYEHVLAKLVYLNKTLTKLEYNPTLRTWLHSQHNLLWLNLNRHFSRSRGSKRQVLKKKLVV